MTAALIGMLLFASCSSTDDGPADEGSTSVDGEFPSVEPPAFVLDVREAIAAVEAELGGPQEFFEVTANPAVTTFFVAVDNGSAAVAYTYVDDELEAPAPQQDGASGQTFTSDQLDFVDDRIFSEVTAQLPTSTVDAISVYGNGVGTTYVLAATSAEGGFLDIVVGADGAIFSVDPV